MVFETSLPKNKINHEIKAIPFLDARRVERFYTDFSNTKRIDLEEFRGFGKEEAYKAPHILIKEGQKDKRFCASFVDFDCSFRRTIYGISSTKRDVDELKILTAFLNSSFASYFLFLTSASWGVERERVQANEVLGLPEIPFLFDTITKEHLVNKIDEIINIKRNEVLKASISDQEEEINILISLALGISSEEKHLMEDALLYSLDLFQKGEDSVAYKRCTMDESTSYAKILCSNINELLKYEDIRVGSTVYEIPMRLPLNIVAIHFNMGFEVSTEEKARVEKSSQKINSLLSKIDNYTYERFSESIYFRKTVKYSVDDTIYLIKPNEKRFWSRSVALNDADDIMLEFAYA